MTSKKKQAKAVAQRPVTAYTVSRYVVEWSGADVEHFGYPQAVAFPSEVFAKNRHEALLVVAEWLRTNFVAVPDTVTVRNTGLAPLKEIEPDCGIVAWSKPASRKTSLRKS